MINTAAHTNTVKLEFPSHSCNEAFARGVIAAFLISEDPTIEELSDIKTAVSEAVTNCIVHAYPDTVGVIEMECSLDDGTVSVVIEDHGVGIEDIEKARTPMFSTGGDQRSGMGFTIMERFMDTFEVTSAQDAGTKIVMSRTLRGRAWK